MKKFLTVLLAFVMVATMVVSVSAAVGEQQSDVVVKISEADEAPDYAFKYDWTAEFTVDIVQTWDADTQEYTRTCNIETGNDEFTVKVTNLSNVGVTVTMEVENDEATFAEADDLQMEFSTAQKSFNLDRAHEGDTPSNSLTVQLNADRMESFIEKVEGATEAEYNAIKTKYAAPIGTLSVSIEAQ